ncbi:MAG: imidazole glycerol phosphate synthase subunit HisH, partial [Candidatus Omnitrophica bacterium]|nr:imidazole glycerol phosphate synthase subunit HisH [Candidatus Omnitrophota bacterium]
GICLGLPLMAKESSEHGQHQGLGWIDASTESIRPDKDLRVPHIGWDELRQLKPDPLFSGIDHDSLFYYVHSYYVKCNDPQLVIGECEYGVRFAAVLHQKNIFGTQFHPEKSQLAGITLLKNFFDQTEHA